MNASHRALRVGVVGTGYWASEVHLPGVMAASGTEAAGLWGRDPAKVAAIAARRGVTGFDSFDAMLAAVDAITIAVPPQVQPGLAVQAARAGKHLILEKPIATDVATARAIANAVRDAGVASLVFFTRRFQPEIAAAIDAASGEAWTQADIRVHSPAMVVASPYAGSPWRQEAGAALWDIGPHVLSVLLPLLGDLGAVARLPAPDRVVRLRTEHVAGGVADISLSLHSPPEQASNAYRLRSPARELVLPSPKIDAPATFALAVTRLAEMVRTGRTTDPCDVQQGARIVEILSQA